MIKGDTYEVLIQKLLDQCKKWSKGDRVGRLYEIGQFEFAKDYTDIECEILFDIAISSEMFETYKKETKYRNSLIKLTKEGYKCISKNDWNYRKYLKSLKNEKRDIYHKLLLLFIGLLAGIATKVGTEYVSELIKHKKETPREYKKKCSFQYNEVHDTTYINSEPKQSDSVSY
ncbi:hypothetical protein [Crocinitomix algicola]|uniref:hypothetical protein n=1 Tax=Crocinitomix algicola TaxID=1740263 RepID=UPI000872BE0F|nr:hypothetical protein [Crocinitomix algicola]